MDRQAISRRQLLEKAGIGFGSMLLLLPYKSFANEETQSLATIFSGDDPINDAWRKRLEHDSTRPLVDLLLRVADERLADPLPANEVGEIRTKVATVPDISDPAIQKYIAVGLAHAALFYYPPLFALAYQLSHETQYKRRALEWLDVFASWPAPPAWGSQTAMHPRLRSAATRPNTPWATGQATQRSELRHPRQRPAGCRPTCAHHPEVGFAAPREFPPPNGAAKRSRRAEPPNRSACR